MLDHDTVSEQNYSSDKSTRSQDDFLNCLKRSKEVVKGESDFDNCLERAIDIFN